MAPTIFYKMPRRKLPNTDFGQRLAHLRSERAITQVMLAETIGSTQRNISYYENHASYPPADVVIEIAKALDISADELLGITKSKSKAKHPVKPEDQRLWKKFRKIGQLPEKDQRAVIRLINSLAQAR